MVMLMECSASDIETMKPVYAWKNPIVARWGQAMKTSNKPLDAAGEFAMKIPGVERVIEQAMGGLFGLLGDTK